MSGREGRGLPRPSGFFKQEQMNLIDPFQLRMRLMTSEAERANTVQKRARVRFIKSRELTMPDCSTIERFEVGDLVAFEFPFPDGGSKTRICAVVAIEPDRGEAVVSYGTSNLRLNADPNLAVTLRGPENLRQAGLHRPTRIQVDRRVRVNLRDERFRKSGKLGTAKVGSLSARFAQALGDLYDHLPATARHKEFEGIHPRAQISNPKGRPGFLRRRNRRNETPAEVRA